MAQHDFLLPQQQRQPDFLSRLFSPQMSPFWAQLGAGLMAAGADVPYGQRPAYIGQAFSQANQALQQQRYFDYLGALRQMQTMNIMSQIQERQRKAQLDAETLKTYRDFISGMGQPGQTGAMGQAGTGGVIPALPLTPAEQALYGLQGPGGAGALAKRLGPTRQTYGQPFEYVDPQTGRSGFARAPQYGGGLQVIPGIVPPPSGPFAIPVQPGAPPSGPAATREKPPPLGYDPSAATGLSGLAASIYGPPLEYLGFNPAPEARTAKIELDRLRNEAIALADVEQPGRATDYIRKLADLLTIGTGMSFQTGLFPETDENALRKLVSARDHIDETMAEITRLLQGGSLTPEDRSNLTQSMARLPGMRARIGRLISAWGSPEMQGGLAPGEETIINGVKVKRLD